MRRVRLAPLEPDAFLVWGFHHGGVVHAKHDSPLTLDDVVWEIQRTCPAVTREQLHKDYVRIAARVRFNQRCGLDPWAGGIR
jgi:hypothetical protein